MDLNQIQIADIQPSQFYLSEEKIIRITSWFCPSDLSNFEPVPIKELNGRLIFTDGHTRAFVAHRAGLTKIPLVWDEDVLDDELYHLCVSACRSRGITRIADLKNRVLPKSEYLLRWNGWCDVLHEILELQRK